MPVPARVATRLANALKKFQPILQSAKTRDINESDTVVIVADLLQEIFGYDKYADITSEHCIKGTYVDLAVKIDGVLQALIEIKAIGLELKDAFVKQAGDYGANQGVDWMILTTGVVWRVYRIHFTKPIDFELVFEFNLLEMNPKDEDHINILWMVAKESWHKESLKEFHAQKQALNKFLFGALLQSDPVVDVIRRELRRVTPNVKIETEQVITVLTQEVLKREVLEGDKAEAARKLISRAAKKSLRATSKADDDDDAAEEAVAVAVAETITPAATTQ